MGSPALHPKAAANWGMFDTGPFVLQRPGECGSVLILTRWASGVMFCRQIWAHARKNRCSGVKPSISARRPFSASAFSRAAYEIDSPPRSARFSPSVSLHVNGKLTLGENLADLGGLSISYAALEKAQIGRAHV